MTTFVFYDFLHPLVNGELDQQRLNDGIDFVTSIMKIRISNSEAARERVEELCEKYNLEFEKSDIDEMWKFISVFRPDIVSECLSTLHSVSQYMTSTTKRESLVSYVFSSLIKGYLASREEGARVYKPAMPTTINEENCSNTAGTEGDGYISLPPIERYGFRQEIDTRVEGKEYENTILKKILLFILNVIEQKKRDVSETVELDAEEFVRATGSMYVNKGKNVMYICNEKVDISSEVNILRRILRFVYSDHEVVGSNTDIIVECVKLIYVYDELEPPLNSASTRASVESIYSISQDVFIRALNMILQKEVDEVATTTVGGVNGSGGDFDLFSGMSGSSTPTTLTLTPLVKCIIDFTSLIGVRSFLLNSRLRCSFNEGWIFSPLEEIVSSVKELLITSNDTAPDAESLSFDTAPDVEIMETRVNPENLTMTTYWKTSYLTQLHANNSFGEDSQRFESSKFLLELLKWSKNLLMKGKGEKETVSDIADIVLRTMRFLKMSFSTPRFSTSEDGFEEEIPRDGMEFIEEIDSISESITTFILLIGSGKYDSFAEDVTPEELSYLDDILGLESTTSTANPVYENSENVHQVMKAVDEFISRGSDLHSADHWEIVKEVVRMIDEVVGDDVFGGMKKDCQKAIDRISTDRSIYGNGLTLVSVFDMVWTQISNYEHLDEAQSCISQFIEEEPDESFETIVERCKKTLRGRFIEELKEMSGTCGSGHAARLVNVFTGFLDIPVVSFDWYDDISNTFHLHFMKKMESESDENKDILLMSSIDSQIREENLDFVTEWMTSTASEIHEILFDDYVNQGYIEEAEYNEIFDRVKGRYTQISM